LGFDNCLSISQRLSSQFNALQAAPLTVNFDDVRAVNASGAIVYMAVVAAAV